MGGASTKKGRRAAPQEVRGPGRLSRPTSWEIQKRFLATGQRARKASQSSENCATGSNRRRLRGCGDQPPVDTEGSSNRAVPELGARRLRHTIRNSSEAREKMDAKYAISTGVND